MELEPNTVAESSEPVLSSREIAVLQLIARGRLNKEAASELAISVKTVEKHRHSLRKKLRVQSTAGLIHFAVTSGLI